MNQETGKRIRLRKIKIENFKILDSIEIEFPLPRMEEDVDVFAMGSRNGLGKTAVLECCALLFLAGAARSREIRLDKSPDLPFDLFDLLVRCGAGNSRIEGTFELDGTTSRIEVVLNRNMIKATGDTEVLGPPFSWSRFSRWELNEGFLFSLVGLGSDPLLVPPLLYFHSYRKVAEGNPELGMMVDSRSFRRISRTRRGSEFPVSDFKLELLRSMMSKADLFEGMENSEGEASLEMMNELVLRYAGGTISKLRPSDDNTVDFRVRPAGEADSFTFDGLSSGQKEIISTLYLIWHHTTDQPGIVLIDEPELHLNSEWQVDFLDQLHKIAPKNQYIIATHSEDIFTSVPADRRIILRPSTEGGT